MFTLFKSLKSASRLGQLFRNQPFSTTQPAAPGGQSPLGQADQTPLHLRPYNKEKYEVISSKIKVTRGRANL